MDVRAAEKRHSVAVVRSDEHEMCVGNPPRRFLEMIDSFPCGETADVKDDRGALRNAQLRADPVQRAAEVRARKSIPAYAHAVHIDSARNDRIALSIGSNDNSRRGPRDAAIERRVERALQQNLAQAGLEHPERLEHGWDSAH